MTACPHSVSARNPFEVFMLVALILVGLPYIFGYETSEAMEKVLHHSGLYWGMAVALGASVCLWGISLRDKRTGVIVEQVGLVVVGVCMLFYGTVVGLANYRDIFGAIAPIGLAGAYGCSCLWRWAQLQRLVKRAVREAQAS